MSELKRLGKLAAEALEKAKKPALKLVDNAMSHAEADPQDFYKTIEQVRGNKNPLFGANITQYSPEDYAKFKTYLSPDGKSGYAIKPDGELISVFSLDKGRGERILDEAVQNGAQKLDAFDIKGKLPKLYSKYFDETERFKFDPKQAPADWNKAALGEPDVVMMKLNPKKVEAVQQAAKNSDGALSSSSFERYADKFKALEEKGYTFEMPKTTRPGPHVVIARDASGKSVGRALIDNDGVNKTMKVYRVDVDEAHQKQGIATRLYKEAIDTAKRDWYKNPDYKIIKQSDEMMTPEGKLFREQLSKAPAPPVQKSWKVEQNPFGKGLSHTLDNGKKINIYPENSQGFYKVEVDGSLTGGFKNLEEAQAYADNTYFSPDNAPGVGTAVNNTQKVLDEVRALGPGQWAKLPLEKRNEYLQAIQTVTGQSQAERATSFGGKKDFFHGTPANKEFQTFDSSKAEKSNTLGPGRDLGSYFTSNPEIASEYAGDAGSIFPVKINRKGTNALELEGGEIGFPDAENAKTILEKKSNVTMLGDKGVPANYDKNLAGDTVIVKDGKTVRSKNAAFDPYFKDSDNILAAKESKQGTFSKALDMLGKPQRMASNKIAEAVGLRPEGTSEENFANVADKAGDALGVPRDSTTGNALKALGVAGAEVFLDPLNAIPIGKVAKVAGKALKGLPEMKALGTIASTASKLKQEVAAVATKKLSRAQELERLANLVKKNDAALVSSQIVTPTEQKLMGAKFAQETEPTLKVQKSVPKEGDTLDYKQILQDYRNKSTK